MCESQLSEECILAGLKGAGQVSHEKRMAVLGDCCCQAAQAQLGLPKIEPRKPNRYE